MWSRRPFVDQQNPHYRTSVNQSRRWGPLRAPVLGQTEKVALRRAPELPHHGSPRTSEMFTCGAGDMICCPPPLTALLAMGAFCLVELGLSVHLHFPRIRVPSREADRGDVNRSWWMEQCRTGGYRAID